jgi:hypothetical protein
MSKPNPYEAPKAPLQGFADGPDIRAGMTIGGLIGMVVGGIAGKIDYDSVVESAKRVHGEVDYLPVGIPVMAFFFGLAGAFGGGMVALGLRLWARLVPRRRAGGGKDG